MNQYFGGSWNSGPLFPEKDKISNDGKNCRTFDRTLKGKKVLCPVLKVLKGNKTLYSVLKLLKGKTMYCV